MQIIKTLLAVLSLFTLLACDRRISRELYNIESCIPENPDSALVLLHALDSSSIAGDNEKAHYYLLNVWALYKAYKDDITFLPQAEKAAAWYESHGSDYHRMLSQFYYGDLQYSNGDLSGAMLSFSEALDLAESLGEWFYAGMCSRGIGDVYSSTFLHEKGCTSYKKAFNYFKLAGYPVHTDYAKLQYAMECGNAGFYNEARHAYDSLLSITTNDIRLRCESLVGYASLFLHPDHYDPAKAYENLEIAIGSQNACPTTFFAAVQMSRACFGLKKIEEGYSYLEEARKLASSREDMAKVSYVEYLSQRDASDPALSALESSVAYADSAFTEVCSHFVNKAIHEREMRNLSMTVSRLKKSRSTIAVVLTGGMIILILLILLFIFVRKDFHNKLLVSKMEIDHYQSAVEELENKVKEYSSSDSHDSTLAIFSGVLNDLCMNYYEPHIDKSSSLLKEFQGIVDSFRPGSELMGQFVLSIDKKHGGLISKCKSCISSFSDVDCAILAYKLVGLSNTSMSVFLNTTKENVATKVNRLKNKILASELEEKNIVQGYFISYSRSKPASVI